MHDERPCYAADALLYIRRVLVSGRPTGIALPDPCIMEVKAENPGTDAGVQAALMQRIKRYTSVPKSVEEKYAKVLLEEYKKSIPKT